MKIIECKQNDEIWEKARCGKITSSGMSQIISPTGKASTQVSKYISRLIAERIRGEKDGWAGNKHSDRGHEFEQEAVDYYAMLYDVEPQLVGFCLTDDETIGASPDRLIGGEGILEIKTCLSEIMIEHYEKDDPKAFLEQEHRPQTQCQLFVTDRKWVDTMLSISPLFFSVTTVLSSKFQPFSSCVAIYGISDTRMFVPTQWL